MGAPVRVAQVMGYMNGGGVEQVVMNYYRHIDRTRVQFDFLVCEGSTLVPRDEIDALGGRVFMVPPYSNLLAFQGELGRLFRRERWAIVHSHMNALSVFSLRAAARAGVPVRIAHSHATSSRGEHMRNAVKNLLRTRANRYPTHRFACSLTAGKWLFGDDADFEVVRNAIDLQRFAFDEQVRASARRDLGFCSEEFVVLHIGRFATVKNHRFLIDAFSDLIFRRPESVLVLAGDGELRSSVEAWVEERGIAGCVRFLGQRSDAERLYAAADAFVLPSLYEGLGLVAIEAQRSGLPCLLSDTVTREVDLTGRIRFLPIGGEGAASAWADALCRIRVGERFGVRDDDFTDYDISAAAERLCERYEALLLRQNMNRSGAA